MFSLLASMLCEKALCAVISFALSPFDNLTEGFSLCVFHIFGEVSLVFTAIIPFQVF